MTINQEALEEVRTAVAAVRDPEYPDLNIEPVSYTHLTLPTKA